MGFETKDNEADFFGSGPDKCPIIGPSQSWSSARKDLDRWKWSTSIADKLIAAHIVSRAFSRNVKFQQLIDLMDEADIRHKDGYDNLLAHIDEAEAVDDIPEKFGRIKLLLDLRRKNDEDLSTYLLKFRRALRHVNDDGLVEVFDVTVDENQNDQQQFAALLLACNANLSGQQLSNLSVFCDLGSDQLTVEKVINALKRTAMAKDFNVKSANMALETHTFESTAAEDWSDHVYQQEEYQEPDPEQFVYQSNELIADANIEWNESTEIFQVCYDDGTHEDVFWQDDQWVNQSYLAVSQCRICKQYGHWGNECPRKGGKSKGKGKGGKPFKGKGFGKGFKSKGFKSKGFGKGGAGPFGKGYGKGNKGGKSVLESSSWESWGDLGTRRNSAPTAYGYGYMVQECPPSSVEVKSRDDMNVDEMKCQLETYMLKLQDTNELRLSCPVLMADSDLFIVVKDLEEKIDWFCDKIAEKEGECVESEEPARDVEVARSETYVNVVQSYSRDLIDFGPKDASTKYLPKNDQVQLAELYANQLPPMPDEYYSSEFQYPDDWDDKDVQSPSFMTRIDEELAREKKSALESAIVSIAVSDDGSSEFDDSSITFSPRQLILFDALKLHLPKDEFKKLMESAVKMTIQAATVFMEERCIQDEIDVPEPSLNEMQSHLVELSSQSFDILEELEDEIMVTDLGPAREKKMAEIHAKWEAMKERVDVAKCQKSWSDMSRRLVHKDRDDLISEMKNLRLQGLPVKVVPKDICRKGCCGSHTNSSSDEEFFVTCSDIGSDISIQSMPEEVFPKDPSKIPANLWCDSNFVESTNEELAKRMLVLKQLHFIGHSKNAIFERDEESSSMEVRICPRYMMDLVPVMINDGELDWMERMLLRGMLSDVVHEDRIRSDSDIVVIEHSISRVQNRTWTEISEQRDAWYRLGKNGECDPRHDYIRDLQVWRERGDWYRENRTGRLKVPCNCRRSLSPEPCYRIVGCDEDEQYHLLCEKDLCNPYEIERFSKHVLCDCGYAATRTLCRKGLNAGRVFLRCGTKSKDGDDQTRYDSCEFWSWEDIGFPKEQVMCKCGEPAAHFTMKTGGELFWCCKTPSTERQGLSGCDFFKKHKYIDCWMIEKPDYTRTLQPPNGRADPSTQEYQMNQRRIYSVMMQRQFVDQEACSSKDITEKDPCKDRRKAFGDYVKATNNDSCVGCMFNKYHCSTCKTLNGSGWKKSREEFWKACEHCSKECSCGRYQDVPDPVVSEDEDVIMGILDDEAKCLRDIEQLMNDEKCGATSSDKDNAAKSRDRIHDLIDSVENISGVSFFSVTKKQSLAELKMMSVKATKTVADAKKILDIAPDEVLNFEIVNRKFRHAMLKVHPDRYERGETVETKEMATACSHICMLAKDRLIHKVKCDAGIVARDAEEDFRDIIKREEDKIKEITKENVQMVEKMVSEKQLQWEKWTLKYGICPSDTKDYTQFIENLLSQERRMRTVTKSLKQQVQMADTHLADVYAETEKEAGGITRSQREILESKHHGEFAEKIRDTPIPKSSDLNQEARNRRTSALNDLDDANARLDVAEEMIADLERFKYTIYFLRDSELTVKKYLVSNVQRTHGKSGLKKKMRGVGHANDQMIKLMSRVRCEPMSGGDLMLMQANIDILRSVEVDVVASLESARMLLDQVNPEKIDSDSYSQCKFCKLKQDGPKEPEFICIDCKRTYSDGDSLLQREQKTYQDRGKIPAIITEVETNIACVQDVDHAAKNRVTMYKERVEDLALARKDVAANISMQRLNLAYCRQATKAHERRKEGEANEVVMFRQQKLKMVSNWIFQQKLAGHKPQMVRKKWKSKVRAKNHTVKKHKKATDYKKKYEDKVSGFDDREEYQQSLNEIWKQENPDKCIPSHIDWNKGQVRGKRTPEAKKARKAKYKDKQKASKAKQKIEQNLLQYSLCEAFQGQAVESSPTEVVLDTGCAVAMASTQALKQYEAAMQKAGMSCKQENSDKYFSFAGGGNPSEGAAKWTVPVPILMQKTEFHEVVMPDSTSRPTPMLMSLEQAENADGILYLKQQIMTVQDPQSGGRIAIPLRKDAHKHLRVDFAGKTCEKPNNPDTSAAHNRYAQQWSADQTYESYYGSASWDAGYSGDDYSSWGFH